MYTRNRLIDPDLRPVQKTVCRGTAMPIPSFAHQSFSRQVAGSGIQRARALAPDSFSRMSIEQFTTNNPGFANASIGSIPPLDPHFNFYQDLEFLKLILFYNEDIGIIAGDVITERRPRNALRYWLITF